MFACAGGVDRITQREQDWFIGFHSAAGDADWVLEAIRDYDGTATVEDVLAQAGMSGTGRALLYDALRMCSSDGALTAGELECVLRAADGMGLPRDIVTDLLQVVLEEQALRRRRYELIVAPVLPTGRKASP